MSHSHILLSIDPNLSHLSASSQDSYLYWLFHEPCPDTDYRTHPIPSESSFDYYDQYFKTHFLCSLEAFIRVKRVLFLLEHSPDSAVNYLDYHFITTPLGIMISLFYNKKLCLLDFIDQKTLEQDLRKLQSTLSATLRYNATLESQTLSTQLVEYFDNKRQSFDIPINLVGTAFQKKVWHCLMTIPYGQTISYSQQASLLNHPRATRAVASANAQNKIAILVPCHRIIRKNADLGGYKSGLKRKKSLLHFEQSLSAHCSTLDFID